MYPWPVRWTARSTVAPFPAGTTLKMSERVPASWRIWPIFEPRAREIRSTAPMEGTSAPSSTFWRYSSLNPVIWATWARLRSWASRILRIRFPTFMGSPRSVSGVASGNGA